MLGQRRQVFLDRVVDAEVDHLEPGAFHHHRDEILADVVDVALDGANHHLADRLDAGLGEQRPQDLHPTLHRVGREQDFGHEQDAVPEIDADDAHALDQRIVQHAVRGPPAREQDVRRLHHLGFEAVVEVVVHLQDQILVVEAVQIQVVVTGVGHARLHLLAGTSGSNAPPGGPSARRRGRGKIGFDPVSPGADQRIW